MGKRSGKKPFIVAAVAAVAEKACKGVASGSRIAVAIDKQGRKAY